MTISYKEIVMFFYWHSYVLTLFQSISDVMIKKILVRERLENRPC